MVRKWYFCLSESSIDRANHGWRDLVFAAVNSARKNTYLVPYLIYDGSDSAFLEGLRAKGVNVIFHRVAFYDALAKRDKSEPGYLSIASGAFLRTEIPLIEKEDEFVLYTDCDVIFRSNPDFSNLEPKYFACAPQSSMTDYANDANSGVLVLNVPSMRETYDEFSKFIVRNLDQGWPGCDQENYRRFYKGKWDELPLEMNWKPYWGESQRTVIVHWHGPKPDAIRRKLRDGSFGLYESWNALYEKNKAAYESYVKEWALYREPYLPDSVRGHIDIVSPSTIRGWALYGPDPEYPLKISLRINGKEERGLDTSMYRKDLSEIFKSDRGGFNFSTQDFPDNSTIEFVDHLGCKVGLKYEGRTVSQFVWRNNMASDFK